MITLTIRTDKPEAEIGLYDGDGRIAYEVWTAHRALAETLHQKVRDILKANGKDLKNLEGVVAYKGPGSFTGLRIGLTVANAIAYAENLPIVAETGDGWQDVGIHRVENGENEKLSMPEYGAEVHITLPKG